MMKILTNFENCFQPAKLVGKQISRFIKLYFSEQQLGHSTSFVSVLSHSESELYFAYFFWIFNSIRNILKNFENFS